MNHLKTALDIFLAVMPLLIINSMACADFQSRDSWGVCYPEEHIEDADNCGCNGPCGDGVECMEGECVPVCGNLICQPEMGENCENCAEDCSSCPPECGNGVIEGFEECDDGDLVNFDGCSSECKSEVMVCGNLVVEPDNGEECDDGNAMSGDGCSDICEWEDGYCGNHICEDVIGETCSNCEEDCGDCDWDCGDGTCEGDETCLSCPADCACDAAAVCYKAECCEPYCEEAECGDDGCGALCGVCVDGDGCVNGLCYPAAQDCAELLDCLDGCGGDDLCPGACVEAAATSAKSTYLALKTCLDSYCDGMVDDACFDAEVVEHCKNQYIECVACSPDCDGLQCGLDAACGVSCGTCMGEATCEQGLCIQPPEVCGDGDCEAGESCGSCPEDCGACCGDGLCKDSESCLTCPDDCGQCPTECADGSCDPGETCESCVEDCGCPDGEICADALCVVAGDVGEACPCAEELECLDLGEGEACTAGCETDDDCPDDMCCLEAEGGGLYCHPAGSCV